MVWWYQVSHPLYLVFIFILPFFGRHLYLFLWFGEEGGFLHLREKVVAPHEAEIGVCGDEPLAYGA